VALKAGSLELFQIVRIIALGRKAAIKKDVIVVFRTGFQEIIESQKCIDRTAMSVQFTNLGQEHMLIAIIIDDCYSHCSLTLDEQRISGSRSAIETYIG
jgi:hypothetical protein